MRAGLCPARLFAFCNAPCGGRCPHRPASAILHRTSCRGGRPCPPVHAAADKSKIDASLRASAHTCPASYRGVCRARVPYAPGCRGNPVDFPGVSWDACRGRCRAQLFATKERYRCGLPLADTHQPAFLNPFFSFSLRKKRKKGIQNRKRIPCRHHVTTHGIGLICPPQITPNCDPAQRSQFGKGRRSQRIWSFRRLGGSGMQLASPDAAPHAILMTAVRQNVTDTATQ